MTRNVGSTQMIYARTVSIYQSMETVNELRNKAINATGMNGSSNWSARRVQFNYIKECSGVKNVGGIDLPLGMYSKCSLLSPSSKNTWGTNDIYQLL